MSTLIVAGSPRKGMYSDRLAEMYKTLTNGKLVYLRDLNASPCRGCDYCKEINEGECIQKDDMSFLYKDFFSSDTISIFSPVYWWEVTAQTKLFIDRLYAIPHDEWKKKKFVVVVNGEADNNDKEYKILHDAFSEMSEYIGCKLFYIGVATPNDKEFEKNSSKVLDFLRTTL